MRRTGWAALLLSITSLPVAAQQIVRLPAGDVALRARPQAVYTVGAADGAEWETFAKVTSVAFDSRDRLYVFDQGNARVVAFDPAGRFVRAIGRRGGGPGEFSAPTGMTVVNDEIVVADVARRSFSIFGTDGAFRRSVPYPRGTVVTGRLMPHPQSGVVARALGNPLSAAAGSIGDDLLLWQPFGGATPTPLLTISTRQSREGSRAQKPVFSPTTRIAVLSNGGLATVNTESYSVNIVSPSGATYRVLERPIQPRRVTARDREIETARLARYSRPGALSIVGPQSGALPAPLQAAVASQLQDVEFARVMPVVQALTVDAAGNLWIQRSGPSLDHPGPIDVVTPQGRYVGSLTGIELPAAFSRRGRAAYVATDDSGVERVVVFRLGAIQ